MLRIRDRKQPLYRDVSSIRTSCRTVRPIISDVIELTVCTGKSFHENHNMTIYRQNCLQSI